MPCKCQLGLLGWCIFKHCAKHSKLDITGNGVISASPAECQDECTWDLTPYNGTRLMLYAANKSSSDDEITLPTLVGDPAKDECIIYLDNSGSETSCDHPNAKFCGSRVEIFRAPNWQSIRLSYTPDKKKGNDFEIRFTVYSCDKTVSSTTVPKTAISTVPSTAVPTTLHSITAPTSSTVKQTTVDRTTKQATTTPKETKPSVVTRYSTTSKQTVANTSNLYSPPRNSTENLFTTHNRLANATDSAALLGNATNVGLAAGLASASVLLLIALLAAALVYRNKRKNTKSPSATHADRNDNIYETARDAPMATDAVYYAASNGGIGHGVQQQATTERQMVDNCLYVSGEEAVVNGDHGRHGQAEEEAVMVDNELYTGVREEREMRDNIIYRM